MAVRLIPLALKIIMQAYKYHVMPGQARSDGRGVWLRFRV